MATPKKNKNQGNSGSKKKKNKTSKKEQAKVPEKKVSSKEKATTGSSLNALLIAICFILAGLTYVVYSGAFDNKFVDWDDYAYVIENNLVRSDADMQTYAARRGQLNPETNPTPAPHNTTIGDVFTTIVSLNYHPLTIWSMRLNNNADPSAKNGISAAPFIWWNVILHILNSILCLLLIYWMSKGNLLASIVVALVFALHPMHVESVAWVSERKDVLYTFFFLGGLLSYTRYLDSKMVKWLGLAFGLFILACLSKAMAVVFSPVMLLLYFWNDQSEDNLESFKNLFKSSTLIHTLPFFAVSLFFGLIAADVQAGGDFGGSFVRYSGAVAINSWDTFSTYQRLQFACYGFLEYIIKFFVPGDMCTFYPYPDQPTYEASTFFAVAPIIVLALLALALLSIKYTKSIAVGLGFYLFTVILVLQFVSVGAVLMADRYTYLPYIGFAFMLVMLVQQYAPQKFQQPIYGVMIALTLLMIPKTIAQIETWQDSQTLWTNVIDLHMKEGSIISQNMEQPLSIRGNYYGKMSEKATSQEEQENYINLAYKDFELASKLGSKRPDVYEGMGNTNGMRGNRLQQQATSLRPTDPQQAAKLEQQALQLFDVAIQNYTKALQLNPNKGSTYFNRGVTYSILRQHENAVSDYSNAIQFAPENRPMAHLNRGISYVELKQKQKAIADFQKALEYNPNQDLAKQYLNMLTKTN